jgi:hypothetical protein
MPRIRTIKPEYWTDEKIVELSIPARLFFIGLWNFADDNGVLENKPKQLKIRIFPTDKVKIEPFIEELINQGIIITYEEKGESYIWIKHLSRHQIIDRQRKSNFPLPPEHIENNSKNDNQLKSTEIKKNPLGREGKGKERNTTPPSPPRGNGVETDFEIWWSVYPGRRKQGKPVCLAKWKHLHKIGTLPPISEMLSTLEAQKHSLDWLKEAGEFIPGPLPYLNQSKFFDESIQTTGPQGVSRKARNPDCPRCHGKGLYPSGTMPDGSPAMKNCECEKQNVQAAAN